MCIVPSETSDFWKFNYTLIFTVTQSLLQMWKTEKKNLNPCTSMFVCPQQYKIISFVVTSFHRFPSVIYSFSLCILDILTSLTVAESKYLQASE